MQTHSNNRRIGSLERAFSMVEIMVVIAVMSILVALLIPGVQAAKKSAQSIKCAGNLRQWGVALSLYATDNGGFYPLSWINNSDHWLSFVASYVDDNWMTYDPISFAKRIDNEKAGCPYYSKFVDPLDPDFKAFPYAYNAARFDYPYADLSYAENIPGGPYRRIKGRPDWPAGWAGWNGPTDTGHWDVDAMGLRYNGSSVIEPLIHVPPTLLYKKQSQCVSMFCGVAACWRAFSIPYNWWFSKGGGSDWNVRTGNSGTLPPGAGGGFTTPVTDAHGISAYDENAAPLGVHNGKDNYLFMDGHVETLKLDDPNLSRLVYNEIPNNNNPYRDD